MTYRHDPYNWLGFAPVTPPLDSGTESPARSVSAATSYAPYVADFAAAEPATAVAAVHDDVEYDDMGESFGSGAPIPFGTLHCELLGAVNFVVFPSVFTPPVTIDDAIANAGGKENLSRLFIGQLPYDVTTMQVEWMVLDLVGAPVFGTERIKKWTEDQQPKGCVHTYCYQEHRDMILNVLHRRVLIDDTGVWVAIDEAQRVALESYCAGMRVDRGRRFRDRPYQPLVAQEATSTFVPHVPSAASAQRARQRRRLASSSATPPPPAYGSWAE